MKFRVEHFVELEGRFFSELTIQIEGAIFEGQKWKYGRDPEDAQEGWPAYAEIDHVFVVCADCVNGRTIKRSEKPAIFAKLDEIARKMIDKEPEKYHEYILENAVA